MPGGHGWGQAPALHFSLWALFLVSRLPFFRAAMVRGLPTHEGSLKPALRWSWPRRDAGRPYRPAAWEGPAGGDKPQRYMVVFRLPETVARAMVVGVAGPCRDLIALNAVSGHGQALASLGGIGNPRPASLRPLVVSPARSSFWASTREAPTGILAFVVWRRTFASPGFRPRIRVRGMPSMAAMMGPAGATGSVQVRHGGMKGRHSLVAEPLVAIAWHARASLRGRGASIQVSVHRRSGSRSTRAMGSREVCPARNSCGITIAAPGGAWLPKPALPSPGGSPVESPT